MGSVLSAESCGLAKSRKRSLTSPPTNATSNISDAFFNFISEYGDYIRKNPKETLVIYTVLLMLVILFSMVLRRRIYSEIEEMEELHWVEEARHQAEERDLEKQGGRIEAPYTDDEIGKGLY
jgi:hypothetical protein